MASFTIVLPGDDVTSHIVPPSSKKPVKLGTGLRSTESHHVLATASGRLTLNNNAYWIQQNISRYRPHVEDRIVGIVEERVASDGAGGDVYKVNIGGPHPALLSNLAFEGATKRNKPQFTPGQLVYARITSTSNSMDPTLSCLLGPHDTATTRKDWMTNEGMYGSLQGGTCRKIPLGLARELLSPNNVVLAALAKHTIPFEVAIGVNGYLWVHSTRPEYTILIVNAICNSQVLTEGQVRGMVDALVTTVHQQINKEDED